MGIRDLECLSIKRAEPTDLTSLITIGKLTVKIHGKTTNRLGKVTLRTYPD
jgi:hypothetical protein